MPLRSGLPASIRIVPEAAFPGACAQTEKTASPHDIAARQIGRIEARFRYLAGLFLLGFATAAWSAVIRRAGEHGLPIREFYRAGVAGVRPVFGAETLNRDLI